MTPEWRNVIIAAESESSNGGLTSNPNPQDSIRGNNIPQDGVAISLGGSYWGCGM